MVKRLFASVLALLFAFGGTTFALAATPKPGAACSPKGKVLVLGIKKYTCIKSGSKLVWSSPVTVMVSKPSQTRSTAPSLDPNVIRFGSKQNSEICKLYSTDESSFSFTDNKAKGVLPSTGKQKIYFAFVRFGDYLPSTNPNDWMKRYAQYFKDFYKTNSFGRLELTEDHNSTWLELPGNAADFGWLTSSDRTYYGHLQALNYALKGLDSQVDFSLYDSVSVVFGVDPSKYNTGTAAWFSAPGNALSFDGKTFRTATTLTISLVNDWRENAPRVVAHEIGHTFGLQDLYAYSFQGSYSDQHRFVGQFDLMGFVAAKSPSLLLWNRWRLSWIDSNDVYCQPSSQSARYLINDANSITGPRLAVVRTGSNERIALEYRPLGTDSLAIGGLVIYRITQLPNGMGSIKVERVSLDPLMLTQDDFLAPGQQKCLPEICVTFEMVYGKSAIVGISGKH